MSIESTLASSTPIRDVVQQVLPAHSDVALDHLAVNTEGLTLAVSATQPVANCPLCHTAATRVQSRYTRTLLDLPWATLRVRLQLTVRRFVCSETTCPRKIFTERLPQLVAPYARRTTRLEPC